ncbi:T-cell differentiation antigen CD6 isoform 2-T2 [Morphnus guianensis]
MPFWPSFPGGALLFGGLGCAFLHPLRLPPTLPMAACRGGGRATSLRFAICEPPSAQQPAREPNRLLLTASPRLARRAGAEPKPGRVGPPIPTDLNPAFAVALGVRLSGGTSVRPAAVSPVLLPCHLPPRSERPFSPERGVLVGSAPHTLCPFLPAAPAEPTGPPSTPAGGVAGNASVAPGERRRARDLLAPVFRWGVGNLGAAASHPAAAAARSRRWGQCQGHPYPLPRRLTQVPARCGWPAAGAGAKAGWRWSRRAPGARCATTAGTWPTATSCAGNCGAAGPCASTAALPSAGAADPSSGMRWAARGTRNISGTARLRRSTTAATRKTPAWCAQVGPARAGSGRHQARFGLRWAEVSGRVQAAHPQLRPLPAEHQEWRLSGGRDGCAGRVEVFFRGTWSTVCDSTWYKLEASVLCRTLGCGEPLRQHSFGHTLPGKMLYQCESRRPSLAHCQWTYNKSAPCHQSRAVGVVCNSSQGLQTPTPMAMVTPSNVTLLSAEEGSPAVGAQSSLHMPLFVLCLVLAALLLLTVLAFTAALLRVRKMSAHAVSSLGLAGPVLVTHSAQSPNMPSGTSNDYREMPPNLPKGPALPTAKDSDSDSDYEHYDFSSKPPMALSTFYNSLRRQPGEQMLLLMPSQDGMEPLPAEVPARLDPPSRGRASSSSTSSSFSTEPYCNDGAPPPHAWVCPTPRTDSTHQSAAPTAHGYTGYPGTAPPAMPRVPTPVISHPRVPVCPADPDPADSSSTSSGEWYENVQGTEPPGDPSPHPGEDPALAEQKWGGVGGIQGSSAPAAASSRSLPEGLSPLQAGRLRPAPRGDTRGTPTPLRAATTMTSRALPTEPARPPQTAGHGRGDLALCAAKDPPSCCRRLLWTSPAISSMPLVPVAPWGCSVQVSRAGLRDAIKSFSQQDTVSLGHRGGRSPAPQRGSVTKCSQGLPVAHRAARDK